MSFKSSQRMEYPEDLILWRYKGFAKFCSLISDQSLFFSHPNQLDDATEGIYANPYDERIIKFADEMFDKTPTTTVSRERYRENLLEAHGSDNPNNQMVFVNCWHVNETENMNM